MPNKIPEEQNSSESLQLLAAVRRVYTKGKIISGWRTGLTILAALGGPALTWFNPCYKVWSGLLGIVVLVLDAIFLEPMAKSSKELGAKIQEVFDTNLYGIKWNELRVGKRPDHELIVELAKKQMRKTNDISTLKDWYPTEVGALLLEYARFICQRSNLRWDSALRQFYGGWLLAAFVFLPLAGIIFAMAMSWTLEQFILGVLVPMLPAVMRIWRERTRHLETASDSARCKEHIETLWPQIVRDDFSNRRLEAQARLIQNEIYHRRKTSTRVPEFFYWLKRADYESQMREAAKKMVDDVKEKPAPTS